MEVKENPYKKERFNLNDWSEHDILMLRIFFEQELCTLGDPVELYERVEDWRVKMNDWMQANKEVYDRLELDVWMFDNKNPQ